MCFEKSGDTVDKTKQNNIFDTNLIILRWNEKVYSGLSR